MTVFGIRFGKNYSLKKEIFKQNSFTKSALNDCTISVNKKFSNPSCEIEGLYSGVFICTEVPIEFPFDEVATIKISRNIQPYRKKKNNVYYKNVLSIKSYTEDKLVFLEKIKIQRNLTKYTKK